MIISSRHPRYWIKFSNTICSDQTPLKESIQFPELPSLKGLMLFYAWDYHFTTHALRKTHYHKIEKSHQPPPRSSCQVKENKRCSPRPNPATRTSQTVMLGNYRVTASWSVCRGLKIKIKVTRRALDLRKCRHTSFVFVLNYLNPLCLPARIHLRLQACPWGEDTGFLLPGTGSLGELLISDVIFV